MTLPPRDWYPDPSGVAPLRYWDGQAWSDSVLVGGAVASRPLPPPGPGVGPVPVGGVAHSGVAFPARAAARGLAGFVVGLVASFAVGLGGATLGVPDAVVLGASAVALWAGLLWACWSASRKYGTGNLRSDFALGGDAGDLGWGVLTGIAARVAAGVVTIPFILAGDDFNRGNTGIFEELSGDKAALLVLAMVTVVGAPLVEELFFRGLLQRSFSPALGTAGAVVAQALLFGLAHVSPLLGVANLTVMAATGTAGLVFGAAAWWRRVPTTMVAHVVFNAGVIVLVLATI